MASPLTEQVAMTQTREPFYSPFYGIFQTGLILSIVPGLPKVAQYASFSVLLWMGHYLVTKTTTGNPAVDLAQGSAIATQLMTAADIIFITHPDSIKDLYRKQAGKITEASLKERVKWAINLFINARGIGWSHESPYTPPRVSPGTSRLSFVVRQFRRGVLGIAIECTSYVLNASNPAMTLSTLGLRSSPLVWRALGVAGFAAAGYARINWMNCFLSIAVVGIGFSAPERWPNLFGSLSEAWSVKRVWRHVWHHLLRKPIKALADFVTASVFRLPAIPSSLPSTPQTVQKFLWLCTAFFITASVHVAGERMLIGQLGFGAFTFFMLQPMGIAIETLTASLWNPHNSPEVTSSKKPVKKVNNDASASNGSPALPASNCASNYADKRPSVGIRFIGYVWVASWFIWSLAFMIDPMVQVGMFVDPRVDIRGLQWPFRGMENNIIAAMRSS